MMSFLLFRTVSYFVNISSNLSYKINIFDLLNMSTEAGGRGAEERRGKLSSSFFFLPPELLPQYCGTEGSTRIE
jgi:hypothetical protein